MGRGPGVRPPPRGGAVSWDAPWRRPGHLPHARTNRPAASSPVIGTRMFLPSRVRTMTAALVTETPSMADRDTTRIQGPMRRAKLRRSSRCTRRWRSMVRDELHGELESFVGDRLY